MKKADVTGEVWSVEIPLKKLYKSGRKQVRYEEASKFFQVRRDLSLVEELVLAISKIELDNTFSQNNIFTTYNTETATNGYTLLNIGLGTDVVNKKGKTILNVAISGLNLADMAYQNHLSRLKYAAENMASGRNGVFNMGKNFSIKVNIPFIGKF